MKKFSLCLLVLLVMIMAGCSFENTKSSVKRIDKDLVGPAVTMLDEYRKVEKETLKAKPGIVGYQELAKKAEAEIPKLKEAQEKIKSQQVIKMTDGYLHYANLYIERIIARMETVVKAGKDGAGKLKAHQAMMRLLDGRQLVEAKFGYERERKLLLENKESYQFTEAYFKRIKKGQTYEQIMGLFHMPGTFLPVIKETRNGKGVTHQPVIWQLNDSWVYVDFVNGRAETWKGPKLDGFWK